MVHPPMVLIADAAPLAAAAAAAAEAGAAPAEDAEGAPEPSSMSITFVSPREDGACADADPAPDAAAAARGTFLKA
jgi:hypothetical protein